jgi:hypothetical protein
MRTPAIVLLAGVGLAGCVVVPVDPAPAVYVDPAPHVYVYGSYYYGPRPRYHHRHPGHYAR